MLEREILKERATGVGEVMLDRVAQSEETATGVFESVAQRDQFFPTVEADAPPISQISLEFFRIYTKIGDIRIEPDEWMKLFDVAGGAALRPDRRGAQEKPIILR